jgi:hypothetical protein
VTFLRNAPQHDEAAASASTTSHSKRREEEKDALPPRAVTHLPSHEPVRSGKISSHFLLVILHA